MLAIDAAVNPNEPMDDAIPKIVCIFHLFAVDLSLIGTTISHPGSIKFRPDPETLATFPFM